MTMDEKRTDRRFTYRYPVRFAAMGRPAHAPEKKYESGEIMDLSERGMRIKVGGRRLEEGTILLVRIPVSKQPVTVPSLLQVLWTNKEEPEACEAGLRFLVQ